MREDVCTVLNEREPLKRQMAIALEEQLNARQLSNSRIEAVGDIAAVLIARQPRVVILDYVLGDVATALDIISALREHLAPSETQIIVWTDDPSVSVAVSAIKLGANDYVQLGLTVSLERVIQSIEHALSLIQEPQSPASARRSRASRSDRIANSPSYNRTLQQAVGCANRNDAIVTILGERGSGRNTTARALHEARYRAGQYAEIDYDTFLGTTADILGSASSRHIVPLLSYRSTLFIDHIEFDDGELLAAVTERLDLLFSTDPALRPMLIVGSSCPDSTQAWARLTDSAVLTVPPLAQRGDDFWPLIQLFTAEAKSAGQLARGTLSPNIARELSNLSWSGNIRQLRASIIEVLSSPLAEPKDREDSGGTDLSKNEAAMLALIKEVKSEWENEHAFSPWVPGRNAARSALDRAQGNYRIAAALLGTGVAQVRSSLQGDS